MDVVTLGAALNGSKKYTDQMAQSLMGGVHYRGSVNYYSDLPANPEEGDSYTVKYAGTSGSVEDGTEYTWGYDTDTGNFAWISFSKDAYSKAETDALLAEKQTQISVNTSAINGQQNTIASGGNGYALINGIRLYVASSAPTGNIPDGSVGVGW